MSGSARRMSGRGTRGCMGRFDWVRYAFISVTIFLFSFLPGCGGHKPPGANPFPAKITVNPVTSVSLQAGATIVFTATAQNATNAAVSPAFTFTSSNPGVVDISPSGSACGGSWNAPFYSVCTPAGIGQAAITASALGATSPPTIVYVHPPIDAIQVSVVPPVNPPPPACPTQTELPAECKITFNTSAVQHCVSQNQVQTWQATAYSQGVDITATVGPFTWGQTNLNVVTITPIVTSANSTSVNVPTNQATVVANTPGATQIIASASGVSSSPGVAETCPIQCISMQLGANGSQDIGTTSFVTNKGTSQTITATAVDVQGCIVPKPPLTWTSSAPAAATPGSTTTAAGSTAASGNASACSGSGTCNIATTQPGAAAITASCSPPTCNVGFPLNPLNAPNLPALYFPQPIFPVTAISGLVSGATSAASILATSQDCYSNSVCSVALYNVSTTTNVAGTPSSMPTPPNSLMFDLAGDKAYVGSQYGSFLITTANLGSASTSPYTLLPQTSTPLGLVTGKILAVSPNGNLAVFSDTVSTPNQVYLANTASASTATFLNINNATTAAFSPDNSKAYILGDAGNTLYVYSTLQALERYPLNAPADAIAFSSSGAFAFIAGGGQAGSNVSIRNTCDNSPVVLPISGLPATPIFLKTVPAGNVPMGNAIFPIALDPVGLDIFFGLDNTGIDVIATTSTTPLTGVTETTSLCPLQQIALATIGPPPVPPAVAPTFAPLHIDLEKGTFTPLSFFLSPDATKAYIVTSDQGVLVYSFSTQTTSAIPLNGNAAALAADMTVDGTLLYVAGSDGLLHELNTLLAVDQTDIQFLQLSDSSSNFCYSSYPCALNLVGIKP
jgi:hypothetical protein